jgi:hypothetical protein
LKTTKFYLLFVLALTVTAARSTRAGTIVGNGAGLVEQNIFYAYDNLPKAIDSCMSVPAICPLTAQDSTVLTSISQIARQNSTLKQRLDFVSETTSPGYFDTGLGQVHRIAKTELHPGSLISINRDLLYLQNGLPALDIPAITAILIHELGHQGGILDHDYLDDLGARVRSVLQSELFVLSYKVPSGELSIQSMNYSGLSSTADLYFSDGSDPTALHSFVARAAHCPLPSQTLIGWSLTNGHWDAQLDLQAAHPTLGFSAWLNIRCLQDGSLNESLINFHLDFHLENQANGLRLKSVTAVPAR